MSSAPHATYDRGARTLVASWQAYARGASHARVHRVPGAAIAVFRDGPERDVYNNALPGRDLDDDARAAVLEAVEQVYAEAGIARFATWAHESDHRLCDDLVSRGYTLDTSTLAMSRSLDDLPGPAPDVPTGPLRWEEYVDFEQLPPTFLAEADHAELHPRATRAEGEVSAVALAYDHDLDCGIYNVSTRERSRRQGLGTALTVVQLHRARARGCRTASLQSSAMAEGVYAAAGFRSLGRLLEFVPPGG